VGVAALLGAEAHEAAPSVAPVPVVGEEPKSDLPATAVLISSRRAPVPLSLQFVTCGSGVGWAPRAGGPRQGGQHEDHDVGDMGGRDIVITFHVRGRWAIGRPLDGVGTREGQGVPPALGSAVVRRCLLSHKLLACTMTH